MANSKYEYVRLFEQPDVLLANTWIIVRIDGRGFSKFTAKYKFTKPNDRRALDLMNAAAEAVMRELPDLVLAYGVSDEFSFVFHKNCALFERRASKLTTTIVSTFSSYYTFLWPQYFPDAPLTPPLPSFDGRAVCYPSDQNLRDYMSWRQVDCHINNLYNTTFWALVQNGGMDPRDAEQELAGTVSSDKNEILFSRFGINYNNEPEIYKKGSVLYRDFSRPLPKKAPTLPRAASATPLSPQPPLSHPQPRPASEPLTIPILAQSKSDPPSDVSTPRGPTFLSTSTTPSPPPSAPGFSFPTIPAFPQPFFPATTALVPSVATKPTHLPQLTPLPLPPPTLTPSKGPLASLSPPAVTGMSFPSMSSTITATSPSLNAPIIPSRTVSAAARASTRRPSPPSGSSRPRPGSSYEISAPGASSSTAGPSRPAILKHRSPSLSILEGSPPQIPLRISSIPLNAPPRKLSLQNSMGNIKSKNGNGTSHGRGETSKSPTPIFTDKDLPALPQPLFSSFSLSSPDSPTIPISQFHESPARGERQGANSRRARSHSHTRIGSAPPASSSGYGSGGAFEGASGRDFLDERAWGEQWGVSGGRGWREEVASAYNSNSSTAASPLPPPPPKNKTRETNRSSSSPSSSTPSPATTITSSTQAQGLAKPPHPSTGTTAATSKSAKLGKKEGKGKPKAGSKQQNPNVKESLDPSGIKELSKTQKDNDRKKRSKARIVIEHVDVIKDEFWERRPWILSGKTGV